MLEPLARGEQHVVHFAGTRGPLEASTFKVDVTYNLQVGPPGPAFLRGDMTGEGQVNLTDPVRILSYLFLGDCPILCPDASDANDDGKLDLADPVAILSYLFLGGTPPPAPGPEACGVDPTPDDLGVCSTDC